MAVKKENAFGEMEDGLKVTCPNCGVEFPLGEALLGEINDELNKRLETERGNIYREVSDKVRKEEKDRVSQELEEKKTQIDTLTKKVEESNNKQMELFKKTQELELKEKELPLKIEEAVADRKKEWEEQLTGTIKKTYETEITRLNLTIEQQKKEVVDMKKRLEQGSQEMQGEVQEMILENFLRSAFPLDEITPVPKGTLGADIIQTVHNKDGDILGKIVWESKNTKSWSDKWLDKLRTDKEAAKGDFAVIVSAVMPRDVSNFGVRKGVLIADYNLVYPVAYLVRNSLFETYNLKRADVDRTEKEKVLYNFVLSTGFQDTVMGMASPIIDMLQNLQKEKASMQKLWSKREAQLNNSLRNVASLYGNVSGIVSLPEMKIFSLDYDTQKSLKASK